MRIKNVFLIRGSIYCSKLYDLLHFIGMKRAILSLSLFLASTLIILGFSRALPQVYAQDTPSIGESTCKYIGTSYSETVSNPECKSCFDQGGVWTAIGCVGRGSGADPSGKLNAFIRTFLGIGTGVGGGIAFLLILFSGFQRIMSAGNPEKLHEAKDLMTAAISGLLLIIFSIFLLRLIGVEILQIPGFG